MDKKEAFKKYHSEMKTVNEAYIAGFLSYEEWYTKLKQLIEKLENNYLNNP
jgi:exonuclease VII small subunit